MSRGSWRFLAVMPIVALAFLLMAAQAGEPRGEVVPPPPPSPAAPVPVAEPPVWLGLFLENAADGGVEVLALVPGGPAARSGVREGDVLLGVGSVTVPDLAALNETLRAMKPGQRADLKLLRDGKTETVGLLLGDRERLLVEARVADQAMQEARLGRLQALRVPDPLGVGLQTIPAELRRHYGAPPDAGTLVVRCDPDGPGARAGLRVGDVLIRAGLRPVADPADVTAGILSASTDEVPIHVIRGHKPLQLSVSRPAVPRAPTAYVYGYAGAQDARTKELAREVERLRARITELEAELEKARKE